MRTLKETLDAMDDGQEDCEAIARPIPGLTAGDVRHIVGALGAVDTFQMVGAFHDKFGLSTCDTTPPGFPPDDVVRFRAGFMIEELAEFCHASGMANLGDRLHDVMVDLKRYPEIYYSDASQQDLEKAADALGDLKYVTDGTAHMMGIPLNEVFEEIQRANMTKERATGAGDSRSVRGHSLDVVKPHDFVAPSHTAILAKAKAGFLRRAE